MLGPLKDAAKGGAVTAARAAGEKQRVEHMLAATSWLISCPERSGDSTCCESINGKQTGAGTESEPHIGYAPSGDGVRTLAHELES
mmetsp:Transcript_15926/g.40544  ORF Transcript_15926/g.40544 Transcript_15926/m.40544 type:complete len:86 (+) Transcript_15926:447-704(+)